MNPAICCGNKIIPSTTATATQRRRLPVSWPRSEHCSARCCCQNPAASSSTARARNHGRSVAKNALAVPAPTAAANPSGKQHPIVATALSIAAKDVEMPVPCFIDDSRREPRPKHDESSPLTEDRSVPNPDITDNSARTLECLPTRQHHLAH